MTDQERLCQLFIALCTMYPEASEEKYQSIRINFLFNMQYSKGRSQHKCLCSSKVQISKNCSSVMTTLRKFSMVIYMRQW